MSPRRVQAVNRWVQGVTLAALLGLAATVLGLGIALYTPAQAAGPAAARPAQDSSTTASP